MNGTMGVVREENGLGGVRFERRFPGSPAELWPLLTEAAHLSQWITPDVTIDARVGGRIEFNWPKGPPMVGTITEYDPPHRLVYDWREGAVDSVVRMELRPDGGDTVLLVDHFGLPLRDAGGFSAGWHSHLDWLAQVIAGAAEGFDQDARFKEFAAQYGWEAPAAS